MNARIVAWTSNQEWAQVYKQVFYGEVEDKKHALEVLKVWRLRYSNKTPVAIETTSTLLEASLLDQNTVKSIRQQVMSASILQFVSLVAEENRTLHVNPSESDSAIPEWLIDIRHQIAHGPFPSLNVLEKAVAFCLEWLKFKHWDPHAELNQYCNFPLMAISSEKDESYQLDCQILNLLSSFEVNQKNGFKNIGSIKINKLKNLCKSSFAVQRLCVIFVLNKHFKFDADKFYHRNKTDVLLPDLVEKFWLPVIKLITDFFLLPTFLYCFLFQICKEESISNKSVLSKWALHLIKLLYNDEKLMFLFQKDPMFVEGVKLILNHNNAFTTEIFNKLKSIMTAKFGETKLKQLHSLRKVFVSTAVKHKIAHFDTSIYGVDDLKSRPKTSTDVSSSKPMTWKLYDGDSLQEYCIGLLPNQSLKSLSHQLFNFPDLTLSKPAESFDKTDFISNESEYVNQDFHASETFENENISEFSTNEKEELAHLPCLNSDLTDGPIENCVDTSVCGLNKISTTNWDKFAASMDIF